jgi:uncharacterized protein with PIN domain
MSANLMVDAMFGKLGKVLRMLGLDTLLADTKWDDSVVIQQALEGNCHLFTRDKELYLRYKSKTKIPTYAKLKSCYLNSLDPVEQLIAVFQSLQLDIQDFLWIGENPLPFEPRCSICNSNLMHVPKEEIIEKIQEGTAKHFDYFWRCLNPICEKIYWRGRHWGEIQQRLNKVQEYLQNPKDKLLYQC